MRALLVIVVAAVVIFGIGVLLVTVLGHASYIYSICALGFASFTLNFLIPRRRRRKTPERLQK